MITFVAVTRLSPVLPVFIVASRMHGPSQSSNSFSFEVRFSDFRLPVNCDTSQYCFKDG